MTRPAKEHPRVTFRLMKEPLRLSVVLRDDEIATIEAGGILDYKQPEVPVRTFCSILDLAIEAVVPHVPKRCSFYDWKCVIQVPKSIARYWGQGWEMRRIAHDHIEAIIDPNNQNRRYGLPPKVLGCRIDVIPDEPNGAQT